MDASDSLAGSGDSGDFDFGQYTAFEESPNLATVATDESGNALPPSLWDQIKSGISDMTPTLVAAIKTTGSDLVSKSIASAKGQILSKAATNIAKRPDVQAAAKDAAGNKIGAWVMTYWKEIALVALVVLFFVVRKMKL